MKRIITIIFVLVLLLTLCSCGLGSSSYSPSTYTPRPQSTPASSGSSSSLGSSSGSSGSSSAPVESSAPVSTEDPNSSGDKPFSGDKYQMSIAKFYSANDDILGAYLGTSLLPGFDWHIFEDNYEDLASLESSFGGNNKDTYTTILMYGIDYDNPADVSKGVYGYRISASNSAGELDTDYSFNGCAFGDSAEKLLEEYGEPDYAYQSEDNQSWSFTWYLGEYYEFTLSGSVDTGFRSASLVKYK